MTEIKNDTELDAALQAIEGADSYDLTELTTDAPDDAIFKDGEPEQPEERKRRRAATKMQTPTQTTEVKEAAAETVTSTETEESAGSLSGKLALTSILPGDVLIVAIDKVMSVGLPFLLNTITGGKFRPADFKLTAEEKRTLKPAVKAAAQTIKINFSNPWVALAFVGTSIYGAKAIEKISFDNLDAEDLGAQRTERRGRPAGSKNKNSRERDYAAEYARRKEREGR